MIYDRIDNIEKYKHLSKWFVYAADFLKKTDLSQLPLGRTEILENHVFVNVMEVETKKEEDTSFEIHKKYLDIQLCINGVDRMQIGICGITEKEEFKDSIDFGTMNCETYLNFNMHEGYFIVCMNEEPHKPTLEYGGIAIIKKAVIKVEVEDDNR